RGAEAPAGDRPAGRAAGRHVALVQLVEARALVDEDVTVAAVRAVIVGVALGVAARRKRNGRGVAVGIVAAVDEGAARDARVGGQDRERDVDAEAAAPAGALQ